MTFTSEPGGAFARPGNIEFGAAGSGPVTVPVTLSAGLRLASQLGTLPQRFQALLWPYPVGTGQVTALTLTASLQLAPSFQKRMARVLSVGLTLTGVQPLLTRAVSFTEHLNFAETVTPLRKLSLSEALQLAGALAGRAFGPTNKVGNDFSTTLQGRTITVTLLRTVVTPVALAFTPSAVTMYTQDTGPTDRFHVIEDGTLANIDLTGATVAFRVRRYGSTANVWQTPLTTCTALPNPHTLSVPVTVNVDANGNPVATSLQVRVSDTVGLGVGNVLRMGAGTATEEDVTVTALDTNHITASFSHNHATGDVFDLLPLAVIPTIASTVTGSGTAQSVQVSSSSLIVVGNSIRVGAGTANDETLVVTAIPDGTHVSGIYTKNHAVGEQIQFPPLLADPVYNARNGYCTYTWPSGGLAAAAQYVGQLAITFVDGTTEHSDYLTITVKQGL